MVLSRGALPGQPTVHVRLTDRDGRTGQGEACGISYAGETPERMMQEIEAVRPTLEAGVDRAALLDLLPHGGARAGVDAALWDLAAKQGGIDPFAASGVKPGPVTSAYTIGIRSLEDYEATARSRASHPLLKIKVNADDPVAAIRAVHRGAPGADLIVDPNQAWTVAELIRFAPELAGLNVVLLEQPIAVGAEAGLDGWKCPIPLCADELIDTAADLAKAQGRFQFINIKLDKAGGLTAAMQLADNAFERGFGLMAGCMFGSSLAMAPAMVLAQRCTFVDLDGPMVHSEDVAHGFDYVAGVVTRTHRPDLWG